MKKGICALVGLGAVVSITVLITKGISSCPEPSECPDYSTELAQLEEADLILEFFWAWYQCERGLDKGECIAWMARVLKQLDNQELIAAFDNYLTCATCTPEEKEELWLEFVQLAFDMLGGYVEGSNYGVLLA